MNGEAAVLHGMPGVAVPVTVQVVTAPHSKMVGEHQLPLFNMSIFNHIHVKNIGVYKLSLPSKTGGRSSQGALSHWAVIQCNLLQ
ncbi:hypothetical protein E2C01_034510 [Portunus trituberculatus]|uniref:Uncharacterized protein n=1 Tax=Portunus trituberculatus TaxID=210409 RepID=A0A5B7F5U9_PORTR|nr:hypothetical protein [Portunus trituberculatus]